MSGVHRLRSLDAALRSMDAPRSRAGVTAALAAAAFLSATGPLGAQEKPPAATAPAAPPAPPPPSSSPAPTSPPSPRSPALDQLESMAAQPTAPAPAPAASAPPVSAPAAAAATPPVSTAGSAVPVEHQSPTDHEKVVGHLGIGFLGVGDLPLPVALPVGTKKSAGLSPNDRIVLRRVSAPALGARIWLTKRVGVDTGIGFFYTGGSTSSDLGNTSSAVEKQSVIAFLLHAGVPIVLADVQHMSLLVVPEATFGLARSSVKPLFDENAPPEASLSGKRLDVGLRGGAEIHFGFMGLPRLALEGSIGLLFTTEWASASVSDQTVSDVSTKVTTTSFNAPWDIFRGIGNVSARYYF